jgi:hypothetical protein
MLVIADMRSQAGGVTKEMTTTYSNIINLKVTPNELLLEFGTHFPEGPPKPGEQIAFDPVTRIILPAAALDGLMAAISQAVSKRDELTKVQLQTAKAQ